ncbi:MAG: transposase [Burkholderia sp.]|nr:MAG: hypothetical protein E5299_00959 [Burkholderia gladioli]
MKGVARQNVYSKRRTWRKVHLALNANTGQVHAALMTNQNVADGDALAKWLDQILRNEQIDVISGDGACDTKLCHATIAARSAVPSIPPREGAAHWPADTPPGASWGVMARLICNCPGRASRMEERQWLPQVIACRECNVSVQDAYRQLSLSASHRLSGDRGRRSRRRRNQLHGEPRSSAIRSYRLRLCPSMPLRPYARFMQQSPSRFEGPLLFCGAAAGSKAFRWLRIDHLEA